MKDDPNLKARMLWFHIWGIPSPHSCPELFECRRMKKPGQVQWHGWQLRFAGGWVGCVSSWTDQAALHLHSHGVLKSFLDEGILLLLLRLWCMPDRKFGWLVVLFFSFESRIVWFHIVTAFAQLIMISSWWSILALHSGFLRLFGTMTLRVRNKRQVSVISRHQHGIYLSTWVVVPRLIECLKLGVNLAAARIVSIHWKRFM